MRKPEEREAMDLMREAKRLKRLTFTPTDTNYEDKLTLLVPFLQRFSPGMGMSSRALWMALHHGDARYARCGFHAMDFDDWCRCLHKMSLFPIPCLAHCLRALQRTDRGYARLIHNLAQSVYICLLYWCVPPHILGELARRASLKERKYVEALTVNDLCTAKDWTIVPSSFYACSMHTPSCAHVFSTTYDALVRFEMEPCAIPCCSLVPKCPRLLGRLWKFRNLVSGQRVDSFEDALKRLHMGELTFEDLFHQLTIESSWSHGLMMTAA